MIRMITASVGVCIAAALLTPLSATGESSLKRARACVNFPVDRRADATVDSTYRMPPLGLDPGRIERKYWPKDWEHFYHKVTMAVTVDSTGRVVTGSAEVLQEGGDIRVSNQACKTVQRMRFVPGQDENGNYYGTTRYTDVRFPSYNGRW